MNSKGYLLYNKEFLFSTLFNVGVMKIVLNLILLKYFIGQENEQFSSNMIAEMFLVR